MPPKAVPGATGAPQLSVETALQQPMDLAAAAQEAPGRAETRGRCVEVGDGAQGARDVASAAVTKESGGAAPRAPKGDGEGGGRIREGRGERRSKYANYSRIWRAELIREFRIPHVGLFLYFAFFSPALNLATAGSAKSLSVYAASAAGIVTLSAHVFSKARSWQPTRKSAAVGVQEH